MVLGHHQGCQECVNRNAANIAADLEMWQFHSSNQQQITYHQLLSRLHLPAYFNFETAYSALQQLQRTGGRNGILPGLQALPLSLRAHYLWYKQSIDLQDFELWRAGLPSFFSSQEPNTKSSLGVLINRITAAQNNWRLPWTVLLSRFALTAQRDQAYSSSRRPSKRYHNFPGTRRKRRAKLAVIFDTSGSISHDRRSAFFQELQKLRPLVHKIDLIEADYQVRRVYAFTGEIPTISSGGGATNFDPAIARVNQEQHYDGIIYFTDGEGPIPTVRPRFPILWLVTNVKGALTSLPGQVVWVQD